MHGKLLSHRTIDPNAQTARIPRNARECPERAHADANECNRRDDVDVRDARAR